MTDAQENFDVILTKYKTAGEIAAKAMRTLVDAAQEGKTVLELMQLGDEAVEQGTAAVFKDKKMSKGLAFPTTVSINHVVCHGIPSEQQVLKEGDIVNIDVAVIKDGWFGDCSRMYCVGKTSPLARRLVDTTYEAMRAGILQVRPGATLGDVGHAIQTVAHRERFSVVREYCRHGIGQVYHDEPQVLHYGQRGQGLRLEPGMIFTIEPMLNAGKRETRELADGWTVITRDKSLSAQWEHMVAVTETGFEVLTPWPEGTGGYPGFD